MLFHPGSHRKECTLVYMVVQRVSFTDSYLQLINHVQKSCPSPLVVLRIADSVFCNFHPLHFTDEATRNPPPVIVPLVLVGSLSLICTVFPQKTQESCSFSFLCLSFSFGPGGGSTLVPQANLCTSYFHPHVTVRTIISKTFYGVSGKR